VGIDDAPFRRDCGSDVAIVGVLPEAVRTAHLIATASGDSRQRPQAPAPYARHQVQSHAFALHSQMKPAAASS